MKNRNGENVTAKLLFDSDCSRFSDMPEIMVQKKAKKKTMAPPISA